MQATQKHYFCKKISDMENKKINKQIIEELNSKEKAKQIKAIDDIRSGGNVAYLPYLADLYVISSSSDVKDKISAVFRILNIQTAQKLLLNFLETPLMQI